MADKQRTKWDIHVLQETRAGITAVHNSTKWPIGYVVDWLLKEKTGVPPLEVDVWRARMKQERNRT